MRFTWYAVVLPFLVLGVEFALRSAADPLPFGVGLSVLLTIWFWCGVACAVVYWFIRLVRFAWRDGRAVESAQAGRELSEIEPGRIFGRLI